MNPHLTEPEVTLDRLHVEVVTASGRAAAVEFRVRRDWVELWHWEHCCAVLDREALHTWLARPGAALVVDEAAFTLDRMVEEQGRVALSLPDVLVWTLSDAELAALRRHI